MDAAMLERVLKLLADAKANLRMCQSALARAQGSVWVLEQIAGELQAAAAAADKAVS